MVAAPHRATACFYGLLSLLLAPLARFVAQRRAESGAPGPTGAGVRMQLQYIHDNWDDIFRQHAPRTLLDDVRALIRVQNQTFYGTFVGETSFVRAFVAVDRILEGVGDEEAMRHARALVGMLGMRAKPTLEAVSSIETPKSDHSSEENLVDKAKRLLSSDVEADVIDEVLGLLSEALEPSQTAAERRKIYLLRSEVYLRGGQRELAYEDAAQVLRAPSLTKRKAMRLATVFVALERRNETVAACDLGLVKAPDDHALQSVKKKVLESMESWEESEDVCWESLITKSPLVCPNESMIIDDDDWQDDLNGGRAADNVRRKAHESQSHRITTQDLETWGTSPQIPPRFSLHCQEAEGTPSQASNETGGDTVRGQMAQGSDKSGKVIEQLDLLSQENDFELHASNIVLPLAPSQNLRPAEIRKQLVKQANECATSGSFEMIQQAIVLLTKASELAGSKKQLARMWCLRGECYRKIGQDDLAHQDALLGSQVPKLNATLSARLEFLLAATSGSSNRLDRYTRMLTSSEEGARVNVSDTDLPPGSRSGDITSEARSTRIGIDVGNDHDEAGLPEDARRGGTEESSRNGAAMHSSVSVSRLEQNQKKKRKVIRKELVQQANECATSGKWEAIEEAIALLTEALEYAGSMKQRAKIWCLRGECYRKIGRDELAHEDAMLGSQKSRPSKSLSARLDFLLSATSGVSNRLDRYDSIFVPCQSQAHGPLEGRTPTVEGTPETDRSRSRSNYGFVEDGANLSEDEHRTREHQESELSSVRYCDSQPEAGGFVDKSTELLAGGVEGSCSVGVFHALLTILQRPLALYIARRRAEGPPLATEDEEKHKNLQKAGAKIQLQFVKDYWATHFSFSAPSSFLQDLKTITQVQSNGFYACTVKRQIYVRGIEAVERLLEIVSVDESTWQRVRMVKRMMGMLEQGQHRELEGDTTSALQDERPMRSDDLIGDPKPCTLGGQGHALLQHHDQDELQKPQKGDGCDHASHTNADSSEVEVAGLYLSSDDKSTNCDLTISQVETRVAESKETRHEMKRECGQCPEMLESTDGAAMGESEGIEYVSALVVESRQQKNPNSTELPANGSPWQPLMSSKKQSQELRTALRRVANRDFGNAIYSINQEIARLKSGHKSDAALYVLRARCRFELKQYNSVLNDAEEALALDPLVADGRHWASIALHHLGRVDEANAMRKVGQRIRPSHDRSYEPLSSLEDPLRPRDAYLSNPTMQQCSEEAIRAYKTANYAQAIEWCSRGIELCGSTVTIRNAASSIVRRGECYLALGDHSKALADANQALQVRQSKYAKASTLRVRALIAMGRPREALKTCVLALFASPEVPELVQFRKTLGDQLVSTASDAASPVKRKSAVQEGLTHRSTGEFREAARAFTKALGHTVSRTQASAIYLHRAKCYQALDQPGLASQDACAALIVPAMNLSAITTLSKALVANGELDAALIVCSATLKDFPDHAPLLQTKEQVQSLRDQQDPQPLSLVMPVDREPELQTEEWEFELHVVMRNALSAMAACKYEVADHAYDSALRLLDSVQIVSNADAITAKRIKVFGHKARSAYAAQDFEKSLDLARRGLTIDSEWVEGHRMVCRALVALDRWSEASPVCESVLALAPRDTFFLTLRDQIESNMAQTVSTKAVSSSSSTYEASDASERTRSWQAHVRGLLHAGLACLEKKNLAEADARFTDALSFLNKSQVTTEAGVDGLRVKLLGHRARARVACGKYEAAVKDAQMGISRQHDWVEGYRLVCHARMGQGAWRQALEACDHVLSIVPRDVAFAQLRSQLSSKCGGAPGDQAGLVEADCGTPVSKAFKVLVKQAAKLVKQGQYDAAAPCCSDAIALLDSDGLVDVSLQLKASVYINRARCHAESSTFDLMLEDARAGLRHNPQWVEGYRLECVALMKLGRWQEAKTACASVLAQLPNDEKFLSHFAQIEEKLHAEHRIEPSDMDTNWRAQQTVHRASDIGVSLTISVDHESMDQLQQDYGDSQYSDQARETVVASWVKLAREGSVVAQRYFSAQQLLSSAEGRLADGALVETFHALRDALVLWPRLDLTGTPLSDLLLIGQVDAIAWGGPMVFFSMQAKKTVFGSAIAEKEFWSKRVERYPHDPDLNATLAEAAYRAGDIKRSLVHIDKAIALRAAAADDTSPVPANWWYLRARCLPSRAQSPTHWIQSLFSKPQQQSETREDGYLGFIQRACIDDEWMPHACYSLGTFHLARRDLARAKQLHFLAEMAESRRELLGLFPVIDATLFQDKMALKEAFHGSAMVLSTIDQQRAVSIVEHESEFWRCVSCGNVATRVDQFASHKANGCVRPPSRFE